MYRQPMVLSDGETPILPPIEFSGSGQVRERATAYMAEIIEKLNDLFQGELLNHSGLWETLRAEGGRR